MAALKLRCTLAMPLRLTLNDAEGTLIEVTQDGRKTYVEGTFTALTNAQHKAAMRAFRAAKKAVRLSHSGDKGQQCK